jgi:hypothetical protein
MPSSIAFHLNKGRNRQEGHNQARSNSTLADNNDNNDRDKEENGADNNDRDVENEDSEPKPVGFFDHSLHQVRLTIFRKWAITTVMLCTFILAILSLYWGVLYGLTDKLSRLTVVVVSFDGQGYPAGTATVVGDAVTRAAEQQAAITSGALGFRVENPADYDNDPLSVRQHVYDEHAWAAVIVNANASYLLQQAVAEGNADYDPQGAMQIVYVQARNEQTYNNYIVPQLDKFLINVQAQFGQQWISRVLSDNALDAATYNNAPQALNPAIGASIFNLRPFSPPQATPAISIGLIYLIIISFFTFSFYLPIHSQFLIPKGHPPLHFYQLILWRLCATFMAYFFLSLAYSLVSLAFQIPFSNTGPEPQTAVVNNADAFGRGTFVVYWMLNLLGMYALGLASENVAMVIGQPWAALWLIFWVITNVASSFYTIPLAPQFFNYGYAWPLHHVVNASRTIIFDTHSRLGLNFGVLAAWSAVNTAFFVPCALFMRWKAQKEHMRELAGGDRKRKIKYLVDG